MVIFPYRSGDGIHLLSTYLGLIRHKKWLWSDTVRFFINDIVIIQRPLAMADMGYDSLADKLTIDNRLTNSAGPQ
ncbi:hypothetical protein C443_00132 [Haloarcula argentinensis DSM 12282]|nr:hypothetical protein C443_00132 [Haloarcula argentinensis DSM 12282]